MNLLRGKRVLLGVTASIAAYKAAFIVRELVKLGAEVQVILTPSARDFVTPLTLGTLSKKPVLDALIADKDLGTWNNHVELGLWADLYLIAPASANTLAKMATGASDNLLLTVYLSARCPVYFAPAMDLDMHDHAANQANIALLESRGNIQIPSASGALASGLEGRGRLEEPDEIVRFINSHLSSTAPLAGKKVLITAGPTREAIDPVRYLSNHSSGKMGYAIAEAARGMGAQVTLISGPVSIVAPRGIDVIHVQSAQEMYDATLAHFAEAHCAILSAAVADFRPKAVATEKIKKDLAKTVIDLEETQDILKKLGEIKAHQFLIGFALETENEVENARKKLVKKNCDLIVLNSTRDAGATFGFDTNKVTFVTHNKTEVMELKSKAEVAKDIITYLSEQLK